MGYRNVILASPVRLSVSNCQLVINNEQEITLPLEDITAIILENPQITVTSKLLSELSQNNIALFTCDNKHIPNGVLSPFMPHSRQTKVSNIQINTSEPFKKRIWHKIIVSKITNQALALKFCEKEGYDELISLTKDVNSGDTTNREGAAAKKYFTFLFGNNFSRALDNNTNACLNYGYAIIRGCIARSLCSYGFLPCFGVHHKSEQNSFNLADDFIESFRPLVDMYTHLYTANLEFNTKTRSQIISCLNFLVVFEGLKYTVSNAIDEMVKSFYCACEENDYEKLILPELISLERREDE